MSEQNSIYSIVDRIEDEAPRDISYDKYKLL